jgi:hypothetical protein
MLPVAQAGVAIPQGLPGWQAFRVASCAVWPYEGFAIDGWYNVVLCTLSAATTLFFVIGSICVVLLGSPPVRRISAWIAAFAFGVNAHWIIRFGSDHFALRAGYFLWWFSFMFLSLGLFAPSPHADSQ